MVTTVSNFRSKYARAVAHEHAARENLQRPASGASCRSLRSRFGALTPLCPDARQNVLIADARVTGESNRILSVAVLAASAGSIENRLQEQRKEGSRCSTSERAYRRRRKECLSRHRLATRAGGDESCVSQVLGGSTFDESLSQAEARCLFSALSSAEILFLKLLNGRS